MKTAQMCKACMGTPPIMLKNIPGASFKRLIKMPRMCKYSRLSKKRRIKDEF